MDFFRSILPEDGIYCIASAKLEKQKDGKVRLSKLVHISINNTDELHSILPSIIQSNSDRELYFSPSAYIERKDPNKGFRKGDNVKLIKSFYLDVDIRPDIAYCKSYEDAFEQLENLQQITGLPSPWVVDSGMGLHVYWPLAEAVTPDIWEVAVNGFYEVVRSTAPKLVADSARTRDKVALLRLPGSVNHKHGTNKVITILQESTGELDYKLFMPDKVEQPSIPPKEYTNVKPEDRVHIDDVVRACNWVREYIDNKETASEPEWYAALSLSRFIYISDRNSEHETPIAFSKGHPGFSPASTLKKVDQLSNNGIGPATCSHLGSMFPERCKNCPLRGFVNSPVSAGRKISNTSEEDVGVLFTDSNDLTPAVNVLPVDNSGLPPPPKPFFIKDGQVFMHKKDSIARVFEYLVIPVNRSKDEYTGQEMAEILVKFPHDGDRTIKMPMSLLADDKRMAIYLADYGIIPDRTAAPYFYRYVVSYIRELQAHKPAVKQYAQLGWRFPDINDQNKAEFVLGDYVYTNKNWTANTSVSPALLPSKASATSSGSLDLWREGFNSLQELPNAQPLIATALMGFAAPLIEFTPYNGVLVNLYGGSGRGKSTAQRFATSIWGVPNERMILTHDNRIPMLNRLGAMRNLPVTFDELTEMDPEALGTLLYEMSGGRGKERANITGATRTNETTWKTVVISSSNVSIYSKIAKIRTGNNGQAYRVLEFEVGPVLPANAIKIDRAKTLLDANYGLAGKMFAQYIVDNVVTVRRKMIETMERMTAVYQKAPAERFWLASVAALQVGASIARDLNLHSYDVDASVKWIIDSMQKVRDNVRDMMGDPVNVLNQFLLESLTTTVRDDGSGTIVMMPSNIKSVSVRFNGKGKEIHEVFVSKKALIDYCNYSRIEYGWLISTLKDRKILKAIRKINLLDRTGLPPVEVDCFVFDTEVLLNADCITEVNKLTVPLPDNKLHIN